ncbi:hypothetical protein [Xylanimonas ulmi]|uniref:Uncharacterized protein n=1 Tax=Xylanimonas ulmi TaxID=228973 RepID=A0A4Q7M519_9MICO|nr:hypothetical protein [Xylanibacterium ulmi]RZS61658.1 hypothetical protein EV386_1968 [Xylanibacterium ulmi]
MSAPKFTATHTRVGVNMGDHAQDVTNGIDVTPDTTLGDLAAMLHETRYVAYDTPMETVARDGDYITIRIAQPIPDEVL